MEIKTLTTEFLLILGGLSSALTLDTAMKVKTAQVILEELGRYRRGEYAEASRKYGKTVRNGNAPATENQKDYMKKLKISFSDDINKGDAAKLIDAELTKPKDGK